MSAFRPRDIRYILRPLTQLKIPGQKPLLTETQLDEITAYYQSINSWTKAASQDLAIQAANYFFIGVCVSFLYTLAPKLSASVSHPVTKACLNMVPTIVSLLFLLFVLIKF